MSQTSPIRVLIADDHPVLRQGLAALIDHEPDLTVVAEAGNGREAVDLFRRHRPDVTLMDLRMPQTSGVEAIAILRQEFPDARFLVLTTYDTDEDIYRALRAGARAYLLKDVQPDVLLEAVRAVHRGEKRIPPGIAAKLADRVSGQELTERELDVLRLMVEGKSNQEVAAALFISEGTVKTHVHHLLSKLGAADRAQAVATALKRGLVQLF